MPFTLKPISIATLGDETVIHGSVTSGAYMGPESVVVHSHDGRELSTRIHTHGMQFPEGWPVLAEHTRTVLILYLPRLPEAFQPTLVTGIGTVSAAQERVDVSRYLSVPEFWAFQLNLHCASAEVEDPALEFLGLASDQTVAWYRTYIDELQSSGVWPYIRVPLPQGRYVELEMAADVEYQDRIWLGHLSGSHRVLLGYHSGHFSLPALRTSEVEWLASHSATDPSPLLWLYATYLEPGVRSITLARDLFSRIPGVIPAKLDSMAQILIGNLCVDGLRWSPAADGGWINNWDYSQRNPRSPMSILTPTDFAYIQSFFS